MVDLGLGKSLFWNLFEFLWGFYLFINEKVSILFLLLIITKRIFFNSSKTLILHLFQIKLWYPLIIKVVPGLFVCPHVRCVMSGLWNTVMDDHTLEFVFVVFFFDVWVFLQSLLCVWKEIDVFWERTVSVQFELLHCVKVEFKTFQSHNHYWRQFLQAYSLQSLYLFVAFLAKVRIFSLENLPFYKLVQRLINRLFVLYLQPNW